MDSVFDYILSVQEPSLWLTFLNIAILLFAFLGVCIIVKSYIDHKKGR